MTILAEVVRRLNVAEGEATELVREAVEGAPYTIIGYNGKQVRDQIHCEDVIRAFEAFCHNPRPGAVYKLGGGRDNTASFLELLDRLAQLTGRRVERRHEQRPWVGDHIVDISNLAELRAHYPGWEITRTTLTRSWTMSWRPASVSDRASGLACVVLQSPIGRRLKWSSWR